MVGYGTPETVNFINFGYITVSMAFLSAVLTQFEGSLWVTACFCHVFVMVGFTLQLH